MYEYIYTYVYRNGICVVAVGASSQCYRNNLMLLKCELMLLKCQINPNTNKNGFVLPTKCLEILILSFNYKKNLYMFADF